MGPVVIAIVLLLSAVTFADGQSRASAPKPAPGARGQTPATAASPMSTALINSLLDLAKTGYSGSFLGLHRFDGDTTMPSINSARRSSPSLNNEHSKGWHVHTAGEHARRRSNHRVR